jgi:benzoate-CoA ligase family protein
LILPGGDLDYDRVPERFNIVPTLVDRHVTEGRGERPAILTPDRTVRYAELAASVSRAASLLTALGVEREQRVLLLLPDGPEFAYAFFGAMKAGLVPVPLSTLGTADDLAYALDDSRAAALVVHGSLYDRVERLPGPVPAPRHCLVVGDAPPGALAFAPALAAASPRFEAVPTHRDDMAYWLYSSGTTGRPKAVVHLHHDMLFCVDAYVRHALEMTAADRTFAVPRLFFSYGLTSCLYLPLWVGASTVLVPERPDPGQILRLCARFRPTLFFSVPTSFAALLRVLGLPAPAEPGPASPVADLGSLRLVVSAGEPLPAPLYRQWVARTGLECLDGLGATEVGYIYISNRPGVVRPGSSGRLLPGYRARIADEADRDVGPGEVGELWVSGESLAAGYWNKHRKTKAAFVGEWYRTGDRYRVDADGYYFYQGRVDDLLRVGGNWVSPLEVESCLLEHPAVEECAVVGHRDETGLVKPRAFVVPRPTAPADGIEEALRAHVRARLAPFKVPRWVVLVDQLPKTATGKVQRYRLRES